MKTLNLVFIFVFLLCFNSFAQFGLDRETIEKVLETNNYKIVNTSPVFTTVEVEKRIKIIYSYNNDGICEFVYVIKNDSDALKRFILKNGFSLIDNKFYQNNENCMAIILESYDQYYVKIGKL